MPRYLKKKEKKPGAKIWILGIAIVAIAAIIAGIFLYQQEQNTDTTVKTPYCTLYYPEKWSDQVRIEITETPVYRVSYSAVFSGIRSVSLFDISFDDEAATPVGTIQTKDGKLATVSIFIPQSDKKLTEAEQNIVQNMKDDLNNILEQMPFVMDSEETEPEQLPEADPISYHDVVIDTPYGQLTYSGRWEDYLQVTQTQGDAYTLSFASKIDGNEIQPLYDIVFSDTPDLGVVYQDGNMVGVSLVIYEVSPDDSWSAEQKEIVFAMQETVNEIIAQLDLQAAPETDSVDQTQMTPNIQTTVPVASSPADMAIETPYGQLKYPGKWFSSCTTEITDADGYMVTFYGVVGNHEKVHLFSVCFGDAAEIPIGAVRDGSGNEVGVGIQPSSFKPGSDWSAEEMNILDEMMEDVNYLIVALLGE